MGYCESCHRVRQVRARPASLVRRGVPTGTCDECSRTAPDLLREAERRFGDDFDAKLRWLNTTSSPHAYAASIQLRRERK